MFVFRYRRGQSIVVEPRQGDKYPAMISAIGEERMNLGWVIFLWKVDGVSLSINLWAEPISINFCERGALAYLGAYF